MEATADHVRPTMPEAVTAKLFAKVRGAVGTEAARIETKFETVLSPKALTDVVTNLYTVLGVKDTVVAYKFVVTPASS